MDSIQNEIIYHLNKPIFTKIINPNNHLIFIKYTNQRYYKYAFELLDSLLKKSLFINNRKILHTSLYYLLKILYNCGNIPYCTNLDLIILSCFFLGIKTNEVQKNMINITKLKNIYPEKYSSYENSEIKKCETICIFLLKYDINFITIYDCIYFLLKDEKNIFIKNDIIEKFESKLLNNGIKYFIYESPMSLAQEIIYDINQQNTNPKPIIILTKKKLPKKLTSNNITNYKNIINLGNEESLSTSASFGSGKKSANKSKIRLMKNETKKCKIENNNKNNNNSININNNNSSILIKLLNNLEKNNFSITNINAKIEENHNMRYSITKNSLSRSICFQDKNNKNNSNNFFQSIKPLGDTFYNPINSNKELIYNLNSSSNINNIMNSYDIEKDSRDIQKSQNIFRKPLIKNKTSNSNIINFKKSFNSKSNLYKNSNNNYNLNNNNNEYINSNFNKSKNNCSELYINLYTKRNHYEDNNDNKYKNMNKIRGKSILQRYIKKI